MLHALSGAVAMIVSLYSGTPWLASIGMLRPLGLAMAGLGMLLFAVAVAHLKRAFLGNVQPVTDALITSGPYRLVRHPAYLGMVITAAGFAVALRSLLGAVLALFVFLPLAVWRARLEEAALAERFGDEWVRYASRTYLMLPPVY